MTAGSSSLEVRVRGHEGGHYDHTPEFIGFVSVLTSCAQPHKSVCLFNNISRSTHSEGYILYNNNVTFKLQIHFQFRHSRHIFQHDQKSDHAIRLSIHSVYESVYESVYSMNQYMNQLYKDHKKMILHFYKCMHAFHSGW